MGKLKNFMKAFRLKLKNVASVTEAKNRGELDISQR